MATLAFGLLAAAPAQAGHWEVSLQATGQDTVTVNGQTTSYPWPDVAYYTGGPAISDYEDWHDSQCDASTINATITPTLTWTPDNASDNSQPSTSIVVQTYVDTGAESSDGADTLEVNDGFNDPVYGDDDDWEFPDDGFYLWQGGFDGYHVCASWGAHWQVKQNPNAASTVKLDPVTMSASGGGEQWLASTGVGLFVTAYPVTAIPSGAILGATGNWNILVGQNCIPYLSIPGLSSALTVGWPTWTVSGDTFTSFDIGSGQNTGQAIPFPDPNANISVNPPVENPTFFWKDAKSDGTPETISGWAILYTDAAGGLSPNPNVPPSAEIGAVSASAQVQVWEPDEFDYPTASGIPNPQVGTIGVADGEVTSGFDPSTGTGYATGYSLDAAVVTPDIFTQNETRFGNWAWLQTCQLDVYAGGGSNSQQMTSPELDSSFPYNASPGAANGVPGTPNSAQGDPKGLSYENFSDTPGEEWGVYATNFGFKNDFKLYVMYQPPDSGNGVNWVPLDVYSWEFAANLTRPSILSTAWTPNPAGMVEDLGKSKSPDYPTWSSKYAP